MSGTARPQSHRGRRRFLRIAAATAGSLALSALGAVPCTLHTRRDVLLGADTELQIYHASTELARSAMDACFDEARRLEAIFSLHRSDSALSRLNRTGRLGDAPAELSELLVFAAEISRATGGAFDVTVQPLWTLYADHFSMPDADPLGPSPAALAHALGCVDYRDVRVEGSTVAFQRADMAVTLNGIAQGYITDRVAERLRAHGLQDVLVNMGEHRALGMGPGDTPWRIGLADPLRIWRNRGSLPLVDRALATSGGYGTPFDAGGRHHHLFDPRNGCSAAHYRSVSVLAPDATTADALSTGLSALTPDAARAALRDFPQAGALFVANDGREWSVGDVPPVTPRA